MEKNIFILPFILVVCVCTLSAEANTRHRILVEECKVQEHASDDDLKGMRDPNQSITKVMKCFITCMNEKQGKIANNKLNSDGVLSMVRSSPKYTEELERKVREILDDCKDVEDPDRCESGAKIVNCLMTGSEKRGLAHEDFHG